MRLTGAAAVFFWLFGLTAIFAGLLTVMAKNTVHSALFLISSLVSVAALFILARAEFIAGVQILVYVGGVMVLFLFVIMLVNVGAEERGTDEIFNKPKQVFASIVFCFILVAGILFAVNRGSDALLNSRALTPEVIASQQIEQDSKLRRSATLTSRMTDDTAQVGAGLYRFASLPFEIASVLLLVAIIGSVMLARTLKQEASADDVAPEVLLAEGAADAELPNTDVRTELN